MARFSINEKIDSVFETIGGACVDSRREEAEFFNVEIGDFELVPYTPFLSFLGQNDDRMDISDEGYKLVFDSSLEDRYNFPKNVNLVIDAIVILNGGKVQFTVFYKHPFFRFYHKGIDQI